MNQSHITLRWPVVVIAVIVLVAAGAGGAYLWIHSSVAADMRGRDVASRPGSGSSPVQPSSGTGPSASAASSGAMPDVVVSLSADAVKRAGIELATVTMGAASSGVRIPGTVEPNAYKQVIVTPLIAGRVTRVLVELGTAVRRGQTLAQIFSPELADAQTKYLSAKAELEAPRTRARSDDEARGNRRGEPAGAGAPACRTRGQARRRPKFAFASGVARDAGDRNRFVGTRSRR